MIPPSRMDESLAPTPTGPENVVLTERQLLGRLSKMAFGGEEALDQQYILSP